MTNDDAGVPTADAEQRIDKAVDAIRSMSLDLADEVAPRPGCGQVECGYARGAHPVIGNCIPDRCDPGAPMMQKAKAYLPPECDPPEQTFQKLGQSAAKHSIKSGAGFDDGAP